MSYFLVSLVSSLIGGAVTAFSLWVWRRRKVYEPPYVYVVQMPGASGCGHVHWTGPSGCQEGPGVWMGPSGPTGPQEPPEPPVQPVEVDF